jgi:predicted ATPase/DNA-binding CsgD family transcriptional regulator
MRTINGRTSQAAPRGSTVVLRIPDAPAPRTGTRIPSPVVVGRASDLVWVEDRLDAARRSDGQVIFLVGEAGVGKSRLCQELASRAGGTVRYLRGAASAFLPDTHLGPFVDALRGYVRDVSPTAVRGLLGSTVVGIGQLLPELVESTSSPPLRSHSSTWPYVRRNLLETCLRVVWQLAERRPLLLVLEDLQWADPGTLELVRYLASGIRGRSVLLICTYRGDEADPGSPCSALTELTHELLRERLAERLALEPLDQRTTADLVGAFFDLGRPVSTDVARVVYRYACGNPFFTEELIKALVERGDIFDEDGVLVHRDLSDLTLAPAARDLVTMRLNRLGPDARLALQVLAVAGRGCEIAVLARATGQTQETTAAAIGDAYRRHFLARAPEGGYRFRHELVRRALVEQLLPEERAGLHARLASAIEAAYGEGQSSDPETLDGWAADLARHYSLAGAADEAAVYAWRAALRAMASHAYQEAIPFLEMCLAAKACVEPDRSTILEHLGDVRVCVGALDVAAETYQALLRVVDVRADPARGGRVLAKLAEIAHDQGDSQRALARCHDAIELLRGAGDVRALAFAYACLSRFEGAVGEWDTSVASAERAVEAAEASDDDSALCAAANRLAFHLAYGGQIDRAEHYALLSADRAERAGDLPSLQQACQQLGTIYGDVRADYRLAARFYRRSLTLARQTGNVLGEIKALHNLGAWINKPLGNWRRAELLLARARGLARRTGHRRAALYSLMHLAELSCLRGDVERARSQLQTLRVEMADHPDLMTRCRIAAKVEAPLLVQDGREDAALERLRAVWREAEAAEFAGELVVLAPPLVDLLVDQGRLGEAEAVLCQVRSLWLAVGDRVEEVEGLRVSARLAAVRGDTTVALGLLDRACAQAETLERPLDVARLRRDRAALLAKTEPEVARELFRQALASFVALGVEVEADRTRRLARQHGLPIRLRRSGNDVAPLPGGLTAREMEVAMLVARGETNRRIANELSLAEGTVEIHIRHIFAKLGLERRSQLAAWMAARGQGSGVRESKPWSLTPRSALVPEP